MRIVKNKHPFTIEAIVILPDLLGASWTLPEGDNNTTRNGGPMMKRPWILLPLCFAASMALTQFASAQIRKPKKEPSTEELLAIVNENPPMFPSWMKNGSRIKGKDGIQIFVPAGWSVSAGKDGRKVAIPPGSSVAQGRDGRMVAIPRVWSFATGRDGRGVAIPPGRRGVQNAKGRIEVK